MKLSSLTAISPIDGRYAAKTEELRAICSEYAFLRRRVFVEIRWLIALAENPDISEIPLLSPSAHAFLEAIANHFNETDAKRIKAIELQTKHDMKAVEYFIKERLQENPELKKISEFVHFACTSEDINNLSYALMLKEVRESSLLPLMDELIKSLGQLAHEYADVAMLARTHGQPATPTTVGKEIANFVARLKRQKQQYEMIFVMGKINGAVGNFNAHHVTYPEIDWLAFTENFVVSLGLSYNAYTTQIEPHDYIAEYCDALARFNTILIDLSRDMWGYISLAYFRQKISTEEVGSSTMPHKVNPIHFENAEGNLGLANAILQFLSNRLPISRWQRDLVDSTVLRNLGVAIGYSTIAWQSLLHGLQRLTIDNAAITADLEQNWVILSEPIQTMMRRYGIEKPYEALKALTQGKTVSQATLLHFIDTLEIPDEAKQRLRALTPATYLGYATQLAKKYDSCSHKSNIHSMAFKRSRALTPRGTL